MGQLACADATRTHGPRSLPTGRASRTRAPRPSTRSADRCAARRYAALAWKHQPLA